MANPKNMRTIGWHAFVILAVALTSAAVAVAQTTPPPVLIGVNIPRTGPVGPVGALIEPGIQLAVDQVNASGGIKSLGGAKIELRWADNQANPSLAASEEQRLIQQEHVIAVIGGGASGAELTATQMAERLKLPHLVSIATANEISERGFRYVFVISGKAADYARGFVTFLDYLRTDRKIGVKRVIVLNENSPFGSSVANALVPLAKSGGYDVVERLEYPASTSDVSSLLTRIRSARPDVVLHIGYVGDSILLWNTRRQLGIDGIPFIGTTAGVGAPAFIKAVGSGANGALTVSQTNVDVPSETVKAFARAHEARYKVPPENNGFFGYQAVYVLKAVLEKAASRNPEAIREAFTTLLMRSDIVLSQDAIRFTPAGTNQDSPMLMLQIQDGRLVTVWPSKAASTQPDLTQFDKLRQ